MTVTVYFTVALAGLAVMCRIVALWNLANPDRKSLTRVFVRGPSRDMFTDRGWLAERVARWLMVVAALALIIGFALGI